MYNSVNKNKSYRKIIFLFRECGVYLQFKPNDMTQTPISKAIEQLNSKITISKQDMEYYRKTAQMNSVRTEHDLQNGLLQSIQILTDLLPYERELIEGAFHDGNHNEDFDSQSDYFIKTFTDND